MRADAGEARAQVLWENIVDPAPALYQGFAQALSGDLDLADAPFQDAVRICEQELTRGLAVALCALAGVAGARTLM